jgi:O-antigen/teichoic acid export membrane protein
MVWSLGNWVFFILVGRLLGPRDYGLVAAFLSASLVAVVLCSGLQPALAASNRGDPPDTIFVRAVRAAAIATVVVMAVGAGIVLAATALIPRFPTGPALGTVVILTGIAVFPLAAGQLQGEGRFGGYAVGYMTVGIMRPVAFLALWFCGITVLSPLLGTAASWIVGSAVTLLLVRRALRCPPVARSAREWQQFCASLVPNTVGITAVAILTNADVIAARLTLEGRQAGLFAAASAISQGLFLVPIVFVTLVLPRLAARRAQNRSSAALAAAGVTATLVAGATFVLLALPLGDLLMRLTYGDAFGAAGDLLPYYGAAMTCMGCTMVLLYHQFARRDFRYSWWLLGMAGVQIASLALFARSPDAIITVDLVCALGAILAHELLARRAHERIIDGFRRKPATSA